MPISRLLFPTLLVLALMVAIGKVASAEESKVKEAAKEIGQATSAAAREIGHETKKAAKEIGEGTKHAAKEIGHGTKKAAKKVSQGTKHVTTEIGHAFRDGAKEAEKSVTGSKQSESTSKK
jgi:hypothetical protein